MMPTSTSMRHLTFALVLIALLIVLAGRAFSQGYVAEIEGTWKTNRGIIVKKGYKLAARTRLTSTTKSPADTIVVIGPDGEVAARGGCGDGCTEVVVPNTGSWSGYLYCMLIRCGSVTYSTSGTKDECRGPDGIVFVDDRGATELAPVLDFTARDRLLIKMQRHVNGRVEETEYELSKGSTRVGKLAPALYDVSGLGKTSLLLVLPAKVYDRERAGYDGLQQKVLRWREAGIGECTIKSFVQAYIKDAAKRLKKDLSR